MFTFHTPKALLIAAMSLAVSVQAQTVLTFGGSDAIVVRSINTVTK